MLPCVDCNGIKIVLEADLGPFTATLAGDILSSGEVNLTAGLHRMPVSGAASAVVRTKRMAG